MIFPIEATYRITIWVWCDENNPDHDKYRSRGEKGFEKVTEVHGIAIKSKLLRVTSTSQTGGDVSSDRSFIEIVHKADEDDINAMDGESQRMYYPAENVYFKDKDVDKAIKRAVQSARHDV